MGFDGGWSAGILTLKKRVEIAGNTLVRKYAILSAWRILVFENVLCFIGICFTLLRFARLKGAKWGPVFAKNPRHLAKTPLRPKKIYCLGVFTRCLGVLEKRFLVTKKRLGVSSLRGSIVKKKSRN